jgi:diguanylate cyclase (GGDEF)-like protein/PAS domain S-box-containing protein
MFLSEKLMSGPSKIIGSIWRLFVVAACSVLGLGLTLYWSWHQVTVNHEALARAEVIERNLQGLGEDLLDAETGQRGYLLTLDGKYLEPYLAAKVNVSKRLEVLARVMINPTARSDLERIRPLVSAKMAELATTVALAASGHRDQALRIVALGSGRQLMDDFRADRQQTIIRERDLLNQGYVHIDEGMSRLALILLIGGSVIIVALFFYTRRTVTKLGKPIHDLVDEELLRVTLDSIGDAVITTDTAGRVVWLNPVAERLTGWTKDDARSKPLTEVFNITNAAIGQPILDPVAVCLTEGKPVGLQSHTTLHSRRGDDYGVEDSTAPIRNVEGEILGAVLVFHDVSEQRRLTVQMNHRATHDALTGLINRTEFENRLSRLLEKATLDATGHVLMYIDLDDFKVINDACGHAAGDQLLRQVSMLLQGAVRGRDTVARLGGDEFGVLLEMCNIEQGREIAQKICNQMELYRFACDARRYRIGSSIGLVPIDLRWESSSAVLQAADSCCYAAKDDGRNRVHLWVESDSRLMARQGEMQWVNRLEAAIDENRFVLFAQHIEPIRASAAGLHCEVLLRLRQDDGSMILPGSFLPAAERFHLMARIDKWVLHKVIEMLEADSIELERIDTIAVNLSGQSIGDGAFHRDLMRMLREARFDTKKLCFEITETAAITNLGDAKVLFEEIRSLGVRIALDDFGAGASSFGYLRMLPIDFLKIDGQYITGLADPLNNAAVRCFCEVAKAVGVKTIAEFVDRRDIRDALITIGVDMAQGFLIHSPEPLAVLLPCRTTSKKHLVKSQRTGTSILH